ncbi:MAG TPA: hypothetical protein VM032_12325 [Vicinamibacterales bacterium]|nr:hypothetical protein [Vicinamibacterales bacterium]
MITSRTLPGAEGGGLGWIAFAGDEPQREITVSITVAERMLKEAAWGHRPFTTLPPQASRLFLRRALARASAHEIGHYLLRSRAHTRSGLMRARFTPDEIMDDRKSLSRLEPEAVARLKGAALVARSRPAAGDRPGAWSAPLDPRAND